MKARCDKGHPIPVEGADIASRVEFILTLNEKCVSCVQLLITMAEQVPECRDKAEALRTRLQI